MLLQQVQKDMFRETGREVARAAVATVCATTLAMPSPAMATEPEGPQPSTAETSEGLNSQAQKHAAKAIEHFNNGAFVDSEEEFRRVAFFAPNWRPLHFNLAVLAEAQGKLGTAVSEYKEFRPHGSPDEQLVVDQRLDELGRRKSKISGAYKRQIALSATTMTLGVGAIGGAVAMFVLAPKQAEKAKEWNAAADTVAGMSEGCPQGDNQCFDYYEGEATALRDDAEKFENRGKMLKVAGIYVVVIGLLLTTYSLVPLRNAVRSKRQLDGINLGKTRLKWNGGAGVTLRF